MPLCKRPYASSPVGLEYGRSTLHTHHIRAQQLIALCITEGQWIVQRVILRVVHCIGVGLQQHAQHALVQTHATLAHVALSDRELEIGGVQISLSLRGGKMNERCSVCAIDIHGDDEQFATAYYSLLWVGFGLTVWWKSDEWLW